MRERYEPARATTCCGSAACSTPIPASASPRWPTRRARAAAGARRPDQPLGARAARRAAHWPRSPTTSWPRSTPAPTRWCSRPTTRASACRRSRRWPAARRWPPATCPRCARCSATAPRSSRATSTAWSAAAAAAARPAPPPPDWSWDDAARATWDVYEEALAAPWVLPARARRPAAEGADGRLAARTGPRDRRRRPEPAPAGARRAARSRPRLAVGGQQVALAQQHVAERQQLVEHDPRQVAQQRGQRVVLGHHQVAVAELQAPVLLARPAARVDGL